MTTRGRLTALTGGAQDTPEDPRVSAVLAVLGGDDASQVARQSGVDVAVLLRWRTQFLEAGARAVTNEPDPEAARQRDRFVGAFAHEMRTPLAIARGWVDVLIDGDAPPAVAGQAMVTIGEALERLDERTMDAELLALASLGRLRLHPEVLTFGELVAAVPGVETTAGHDCTFCVDPDRFRRVVRDLWSAAHLDPRPTRVRLEARQAADFVEVSVHRQGQPMDTTLLQGLFDPFALHDDASGITIGLYLARALVVAHRGTLGVDQDDKGTVFWARLPISSSHPQKDPRCSRSPAVT